MAKTVHRFQKFAGPSQTVLFGNSSDGRGGFNHVRGAGLKGPVLELKKRLAKKMAVVEADKFRTTKLCLDCGRPLEIRNRGVVHCTAESCDARGKPRNHDVTAAYKIGAKYLANKVAPRLGPWSRTVKPAELTEGPLFKGLRNVLTYYDDGLLMHLLRGAV